MAAMTGTLSVTVARGTGETNTALQTFDVPAYGSQTVLDVVSWIQQNADPTLTYRFACRVGMCGSCGVQDSCRQPKLYIGMVLIWSFGSALGLYGLIVALIIATMIRRMDARVPEDYFPKKVAELSMHPKDGMPIDIVPRELHREEGNAA